MVTVTTKLASSQPSVFASATRSTKTQSTENIFDFCKADDIIQNWERYSYHANLFFLVLVLRME